MTAPAEHETPSRQPWAAAARFLLRWTIKMPVLAFLGARAQLRRRAVRLGLAATLLAVIVGWQLGEAFLHSYRDDLWGAPQTRGEIALSTAGSLPPSPVLERYLQALAAFDGETMWGMLSDELRESLQGTGASAIPAEYQAQLDTIRDRGGRYVEAVYVGGTPLADGDNVYFYVLKVATPTGKVEVPYIYVVDAGGKITSIQ